jgi:glycine reductase complex component B subunit gamma
MIKIVQVVNQFFAGLGGEEKASLPVGVIEGSAGAARAMEQKLGAEGKIVRTVYVGDNYFHEHKDEALKAILDAVRAAEPQVVTAGPAFNSGRYGLACVEICNAVTNELGIVCLTAMHEENPGVGLYREFANPRLYCLPTAESTAGMADAMTRSAAFAIRLASGNEMDSAVKEGYISRGIRRIEKTDRSGAARALDMLLKKINNQPFETELPMEVWDDAPPAPPLSQVKDRNIAVVTTSGVVPWGNPDKFKTYRNTYWRKYNIAELKELEPGKWEAVHGGYNVAYMNQNPHYGVPLDALRALEAEGKIGPGKLYPAYYVIPGNQGSPAVMRRIGQEIAADLKKDNVEGVLFVAT